MTSITEKLYAPLPDISPDFTVERSFVPEKVRVRLSRRSVEGEKVWLGGRRVPLFFFSGGGREERRVMETLPSKGFLVVGSSRRETLSHLGVERAVVCGYTGRGSEAAQMAEEMEGAEPGSVLGLLLVDREETWRGAQECLGRVESMGVPVGVVLFKDKGAVSAEGEAGVCSRARWKRSQHVEEVIAGLLAGEFGRVVRERSTGEHTVVGARVHAEVPLIR